MKKEIICIAMGSIVTFGICSFIEHNKEFNKAMKKMKKQNQKACDWLKDKMC